MAERRPGPRSVLGDATFTSQAVRFVLQGADGPTLQLLGGVDFEAVKRGGGPA